MKAWRRLQVVVVMAALVAAGAMAQDIDDGAIVSIALIGTTSGYPVGGATVSLTALGSAGVELVDASDARGQLIFERVPGGVYRVDVLPPGYAAESFTIIVPFEGTAHEELRLALAHELPTIDVTGERIHPALSRRGFYDRRSFGFGRHLTHEEIMATRPTRISDALARIANVRVRDTGSGMAVLNLTATDIRAGGTCSFDVYVDGNHMNTPEGYFDGDMVPVEEVAGIEIYNRASHAPMIYRGRGCGTVLIWTGDTRR